MPIIHLSWKNANDIPVTDNVYVEDALRASTQTGMCDLSLWKTGQTTIKLESESDLLVSRKHEISYTVGLGAAPNIYSDPTQPNKIFFDWSGSAFTSGTAPPFGFTIKTYPHSVGEHLTSTGAGPDTSYTHINYYTGTTELSYEVYPDGAPAAARSSATITLNNPIPTYTINGNVATLDWSQCKYTWPGVSRQPTNYTVNIFVNNGTEQGIVQDVTGTSYDLNMVPGKSYAYYVTPVYFVGDVYETPIFGTDTILMSDQFP